MTIQETMLKMQEQQIKMQENISQNHMELKGNINKLEDKVDTIQQTMHKNEQKLEEVELKTVQNEKKLELMDNRMMTINKRLEEQIIYLEMDRTEYYLRFQNIIERRDEDLNMLMAELLVPALQRKTQEILLEIDEAYRVQTSYA
uniref:Uncharacterized protein n=1 Tax=Micrurus lemniscatus lemniscatus TaxID=129467 RepID=A0A2D4IW16_MICLE